MFRHGTALFLTPIKRGGGGRRDRPSVAEVGDAGFLGRQRIDEVKIWLSLLKHAAESSQMQSDIQVFKRRYLRYLRGRWDAVFGRTA